MHYRIQAFPNRTSNTANQFQRIPRNNMINSCNVISGEIQLFLWQKANGFTNWCFWHNQSSPRRRIFPQRPIRFENHSGNYEHNFSSKFFLWKAYRIYDLIFFSFSWDKKKFGASISTDHLLIRQKCSLSITAQFPWTLQSAVLSNLNIPDKAITENNFIPRNWNKFESIENQF